MKIVALQNKSQEREECCAKTKIQWLITSEIEAKNTLRLFKMGSGGHSLLHKHAWEHIVFVLDGEGLIFNGEKTWLIKTGDSVFVAPNELHQFQNKNQKTLTFLCIEPSTAE